MSLLAIFKQIVEKSDVQERRLIGIESISNACKSPAIQGGLNGQQMPILVSTILKSLYAAAKVEVIYALRQRFERQHTSQKSIDRHVRSPSSAADVRPAIVAESSSPDAEEKVQMLALQSLQSLYNVNDAQQIRLVTTIILEELEVYSTQWIATVLQVAADWTPIDLRFHIVDACTHRLDHLSISKAKIESQHHLVLLLLGLLTSRVNLVGLSTADVLDSLHSCGRRAQIQPSQEHMPQADATGATLVHKLQESLISAISALAAHLYYKDQVNDLLYEILVRAELQATPSPSRDFEGVLSGDQLLLLDAAIEMIKNCDIKHGTSDERNPISLRVMQLSFPSLSATDRAIRVRCLALLKVYLEVECSRFKDNPLSEHSKSLQTLQIHLYHAAQYWTTSAEEGEDWLMILRLLSTKLDQPACLSFIPVLHRIASESTVDGRLPQDSRSADMLRTMISGIYTQDKLANGSQNGPDLLPIGSLPSLHDLLQRIKDTAQLRMPEDAYHHLTVPWTPDSTNLDASHAPSIRQLQKSRTALSFTASKDHLALFSESNNRSQNSRRVQDLRMLLVGTSRPSDGASPQGYGIDELFQNVELQDLQLRR